MEWKRDAIPMAEPALVQSLTDEANRAKVWFLVDRIADAIRMEDADPDRAAAGDDAHDR
jgi:hypothetical protein